jgi:RNA polymerase primary sigma factor
MEPKRREVDTRGQGGEESILLRYFADIGDSEPLSREREKELAARIRNDDLDARDELVRGNLRFVIDVSRSYQNRGLSMAELISAGNLGLITAAERFDGERGFKFISYAVWWIRQSILQSIAENGRTVRLPLNQLSLLKDITRVSRRLGQDGETEPAVEDIAAELNLEPEQVRGAVLAGRVPRSLDEGLDDADDRNLMSVLADEQLAAPDAGVYEGTARDKIASALASLDARERYILRLYFGLDGEDSMTLEEIGRVIKLTRERVRQLKERALTKLRDSESHPALCELMEAVGA